MSEHVTSILLSTLIYDLELSKQTRRIVQNRKLTKDITILCRISAMTAFDVVIENPANA